MSADHARQLSPDGGTWPLLVFAAFLDGHQIPATVLTAPAARQYLTGQDAARLLDLERTWSALLALERAGLLAVDQASTPPVARMSPALQPAVLSVTPQEDLARAVRAAADGLCLRRAAGDALWADGGCHRLLLVAGQSLDDARLTGPALSCWRELAAGSDRILGPGHPDTVAAGGLLAAALLAAGQPAEAIS